PSMFSADAQLDVGPRLAPFGNRHLYELAHAGLVDGGEGILPDDLQFLVSGKEGTGIVAAHAESGLGKIVGAEAEELGNLRDFVRRQGAAGNFDHGADEVAEFDLLFGLDAPGDLVNDGDLKLQFFLVAHQGDHDFGLGL